MLIRPICDHRAKLGEGTVWDARTNALYWVDSLGPTIFRWDYNSGETNTWKIDGTAIGSLAVRERGGLILAMDHGFYTFDTSTGTLELIAEPLAGMDGVRFNDGKVTPQGDFIAGGMNINLADKHNCPALRLNSDFSCEEILSGFHVFNGPCFSGDGKTLYFTGRKAALEMVEYSPSGKLPEAHDFCASKMHDGSTVDAQDHVWSARWVEGCLLRMTPEGDLERKVEIPDQIVTSVMFGGPALDIIFVTTLGVDYYGGVVKSKDAGKTLMIEGLGITGRAEPYFAG